jgi:hypothetical protein
MYREENTVICNDTHSRLPHQHQENEQSTNTDRQGIYYNPP